MFQVHTNLNLYVLVYAFNLYRITEPRKKQLKVEILLNLKILKKANNFFHILVFKIIEAKFCFIFKKVFLRII